MKPESAAQEFARLQRLTPQEAVDFLQRRNRLTQTFSWQDLWHDEHTQQFTVSRLTRLDLLKAMQDGITKSVQGDLSRRDWMRDTKGLLKEAGWWGEKDVLDPVSGDVVTTKFDSARLKLIFDTNTRMANSAGLWERVWRNRSTHPYVRYITRGDDRVREAHRAWANLTLPVDHPFWEQHWPPNGWRCRCRTMSMSQAEYDRREAAGEIVTEVPPEEFVTWTNKRTGEISEIPAGVTPGFDYNPGLARARQAALQNTVREKIATAPEPLAEAASADRFLKPAALDFIGQRPDLSSLPPVPVTVLTGDEFGFGLTRVELARKADDVLRTLQGQPLFNDDTGWPLTINKAGRKKMGDNAEQSAEESKAVAGIKLLARRAVVVERHLDTQHNNPSVAAVLRFYAPAEIGGVLFRIKLTVKDYAAPADHKILHALSAMEIENAPPGIFPAYSGAEALQQGQPATGRTINIIDLLENSSQSNEDRQP